MNRRTFFRAIGATLTMLGIGKARADSSATARPTPTPGPTALWSKQRRRVWHFAKLTAAVQTMTDAELQGLVGLIRDRKGYVPKPAAKSTAIHFGSEARTDLMVQLLDALEGVNCHKIGDWARFALSR